MIGGTRLLYYWSLNRPGQLEIDGVPADATVLVDNVKVGDQSPFTLEKPPGPYTLSVTRTGTRATIRTSSSRRGSRARWR